MAEFRTEEEVKEALKHRGPLTVLPPDPDESTTGKIIDPEGIDHPRHYNIHPAGIECIDVIEYMTFNVGSAIKYLWRAGLKPGEETIKDIRKGIWYLERELDRMERDAYDAAATATDAAAALSATPPPFGHTDT